MRQVKTSSLEWGVGCLGALLGVLMLIVPHQFGGGLWPAPAVTGALLLGGGALLLAVAVVAVGPALRVAAHLLAGAAFLALAAGYATGGAWTAMILHAVLGAGTVVAVLSSARGGPAGAPGPDLLVVLVGLIALGSGVAMLTAPGPWAPMQGVADAGALRWYGALFVPAGVLLLAVQFRAEVPWRTRVAAHGLGAGAFLVFVAWAAVPAGSLTDLVCFGGLAVALLFLAWRQPRPLAVDPASLSTRLGLAFAMVAAMPLLAAVALVSQQQERAATTEALDVQRALAVAVAGNVADHVERYRAAVAALAGQGALRAMRPDVHRPVLLAFQAAYPDSLLSTYDAQGRGVARGDDLAVLDIDQSAIFQEVRRTEGPSTQITVGRLVQRPIFVFAAPIPDAQGRFAGMAVVALESARMAAVLEQAAWPSGSHAYLVDASGRVIAHPRVGAVHHADLAARPPVASLIKRPDPSGAIVYGGEGEKRLAGYARVPRLGWGVVVERPAAVALASAHHAREVALLFLLGGVVLAVGAGVLAAQRLTRPLDALGRALEGFAAGRPDAPLPPTRVTEVARLTTVFEDMRATLAARTAERERAGAALRRAHGELEAALRRTDEQLRFALEAGRVGIWDWNVRTGEVRWSDNLTPMHGLPPGGFPGTVEAFRALIHPADHARVEGAIDRTLHHGEPYDLEFRIVWHDGTVRWVAAKGQAFTDESAAPARMVGVTIDVTERKHAEETLRESEARYRGLLEHSIQGVCIHRGFEIRYANPALGRIFGYDGPDDLVGRDLRTLFAPGRERLEAHVAGRRPGDPGPSRYEAQGLRRDGAPIWIEAMASTVSWEGGPGVLTTLVDITERRQAEERRARLLAGEQAARAEAEAANRAKDEFLATLSHELRTPLNAMLGWAQLLRTGRLDADAVRRAVDVIERSTKMQAQLIEDLLDVSRIVTGKLHLELRPVWLAAVVEAALEAVRGAAEAKDIELRTSVAPAMPPVEGDPDRLQQVVWNLLSNAIKFTPRGGRIDVTLESRDMAVVLRVQDTGKGIPAHFLPFIFDRFRQADSTSTRAHGGLGLGLAIVRHLVELHGGSVQARSEGEGGGATFTVELPALGAAGEEGTVPRPLGALKAAGGGDGLPALDGTHVLIVDDEPDARDVLVALFAQCGAVVAAAGSAADALRAVVDCRPDVLVSDVAMPGVDGYDLIRKVRALPPERGGRVPAVALTASARSEDRARALAAGFHAHVPKPVEPARLARLVAGLAGRASVPRDPD